ncbi:MAG: threonine--tRNA ligase [Chloroflexi bacterium]|nr:threonine--tRNA ligase [Chloroflexota bacterium]
MADAIVSFFPEAKLTIGPPTEDGFYYDIDLPRPLTPDDLERIEARMRETIKADHPFECREISRDDAQRMFADNPYKLQIIDEIPSGEAITTYSHGAFTDLCEGPHVERTGDIEAVKLLNVAGAYWRGSEANPMLQRLYGTAFESQEALDEHLQMLEEALKRDHRKLGRQLDLVMFDPVAPASPFFLPKGAVVYNLLIDYIRGLNTRYGYQEVITPQIYSADLWRKSGHYDNYKDSMFFIDIEDREFGLKPMNCPGHALMYASRLHSYRDLPLRYADFARLHRNERSGVTHGLTRVRSFTQDDAHVFCRLDQIKDEIATIIEMVSEVYRTFEFDEVMTYLSLRPDKRVGSDEMWDRAEAILKETLVAKAIDHEVVPGEGAFYGPKIDFFVRDALRREWQLGTAQLDFSLPERFELEYVDDEGKAERPVLIHRAMLGSIERFMGILIEHTGGAFPVWLAPVQAVVIPIADRHLDYARKVEGQLRDANLRVEVDARNQRMNLKIREAQLQKVPYMLVVGDREEEQGAVAVRTRAGENVGAQAVDQLVADIRAEVDAKR